MIVITGAAGFISSCFIQKLNDENFNDLVLVDDFSREDKIQNYSTKKYSALVDRSVFFDWLAENEAQVQFIFHLGARTDTTEQDEALFDELNLNYSKNMWNACCEYGLPLVYASSAAAYGGGELGYLDSEELPRNLKPLNPYGRSKNDFDIWALAQEKKPFFWAGLKFFNVYGPNEYHKGRMASVVFHAFNQIKETGGMKLFASHKEGIADGEQMRDFVYVKDLMEILYFLLHHRHNSGLYNLGSGKARSFKDLVTAVFTALNKEVKIEFIPTPEDIRDTYQYFTEADMKKMEKIGAPLPKHSLEEGVTDYVQNYLLDSKRL